MSSKIDLVKYIAKALNTSREKALEAHDAVVASLRRSIKKEGEVAIKSFGGFRVVERAARTGRNPRTGAAVAIPASKTVKFKPSQILRDEVN